MSKKPIEDLLRENLKKDIPSQLDENFYNFTRELKSETQAKKPIFWKTAFAFSFVFALFVYNFQYQGDAVPTYTEAEILENVELLNNMEVLADMEGLSEEEIDYLLEEGSVDEV
jgi:hypothetical protein